jgi:hypothetical protein
MLTPENYIRQKARTLPVYQCLVNTDWEDSGLANIIVARNHTTGNFTAGMYLVDLHCLGVKDASYWFNISETKYSQILAHAKASMELEQVSYELVHNIVFAALEFAEEYGFKPHKDYTSVAQYILEEDTEDIELIEIECGVDGKPSYVRGPYDDDAKVARILAQLEKTAGPDNYYFIDEDDEDWVDEDDEDDDFDDLDDEDIEFIPSDTTFQFKIVLDGVADPNVWRRIKLPSNTSFLDFHNAIQIAFDWADVHLFSFAHKRYGLPEITAITEDDRNDKDKIDAAKLTLGEIFNTEKQKFIYLYDFGDSWEHIITLEKIIPETISEPECLGGEGKCPPEDCGGVLGYQELKKILADKNHPEYKDYAKWLGLKRGQMWDAAEFDLKKINKFLAPLFD